LIPHFASRVLSHGNPADIAANATN